MKKDIKDNKEDTVIEMTKEQVRLSLGKFLINNGIKTKAEVLTTLMNQHIDEQS